MITYEVNLVCDRHCGALLCSGPEEAVAEAVKIVILEGRFLGWTVTLDPGFSKIGVIKAVCPECLAKFHAPSKPALPGS